MIYVTLKNGSSLEWHVGEDLIKTVVKNFGFVQGYIATPKETRDLLNTVIDEVSDIQADGDELELIYNELNLHPFKKRVVQFFGDQAKSIVANVLT